MRREGLRGDAAVAWDAWEQICQIAWMLRASHERLRFDAVNRCERANYQFWIMMPGRSQRGGIESEAGIESVVRIMTKRGNIEQALEYMGLVGGMLIQDIKLDCIFIGSCTNSRIEDLREAAMIVQGQKISANVEQAMVVPGSGLVKRQAEAEGLDQIFKDAGLEWREPGCSMCLAMNADQLGEGKHCASTSNRNFEGRQGFGGRTHLVSPGMAAAAAIHGYFVDVRNLI